MKHTKSEQEILKKYRNFLYERLSEAHDYGGMIAASEDFLIQAIREERERIWEDWIEPNLSYSDKKYREQEIKDKFYGE